MCSSVSWGTTCARPSQAFHPEAQVLFDAKAAVLGTFDSARMEQVFSNIISNAVKHGDIQTPIAVALTVSDDALLFTVHNSGEPIPEDVLPFIFNPMGASLSDQ